MKIGIGGKDPKHPIKISLTADEFKQIADLTADEADAGCMCISCRLSRNARQALETPVREARPMTDEEKKDMNDGD